MDVIKTLHIKGTTFTVCFSEGDGWYCGDASGIQLRMEGEPAFYDTEEEVIQMLIDTEA